MTMIEVNGVATHCQVLPPTGAGPDETVVFVHGLGVDSLASFYLTLAAPLAAAGATVITYDLRGHGRSGRPDTGYSLDTFVDDLDGLLRALDVRHPVHVVGNSFGGTIAFSYAARSPERVASVVAIEAEPPTREWADKMSEVLGNTVEFLADEGNFAMIREQYGAHQERLSRLAADRVLSTSVPQEAMLGQLMTLEDIRMLAAPVLLLLGGDGFQADNLDRLVGLLPAAERVVFEGQDHSVLVEQHRRIRGLLVDWIARNAAAEPAA